MWAQAYMMQLLLFLLGASAKHLVRDLIVHVTAYSAVNCMQCWSSVWEGSPAWQPRLRNTRHMDLLSHSGADRAYCKLLLCSAGNTILQAATRNNSCSIQYNLCTAATADAAVRQQKIRAMQVLGAHIIQPTPVSAYHLHNCAGLCAQFVVVLPVWHCSCGYHGWSACCGAGLLLANVPGGVVAAFPAKWGVQMRAAALATIFLRCGLELEFQVCISSYLPAAAAVGDVPSATLLVNIG